MADDPRLMAVERYHSVRQLWAPPEEGGTASGPTNNPSKLANSSPGTSQRRWDDHHCLICEIGDGWSRRGSITRPRHILVSGAADGLRNRWMMG